MNLVESVQRNKDDKVRWLRESEKAVELSALLPKEIQELEGTADCDSHMNLQIRLFGGDSALKTCQDVGATFEEPRISGYGGEFVADGTIGDTHVTISDLSVPQECHVEKVPYTAYRYEAICDKEKE